MENAFNLIDIVIHYLTNHMNIFLKIKDGNGSITREELG